MSGLSLLLLDARGIYIPRDFVTGCAIECKEEDRQAAIDGKAWQGINAADVISCMNPEDEYYWEAWDSILSNVYWIDENGNRWQLHQDGDLWAYCEELMTDEEKANLVIGSH